MPDGHLKLKALPRVKPGSKPPKASACSSSGTTAFYCSLGPNTPQVVNLLHCPRPTFARLGSLKVTAAWVLQISVYALRQFSNGLMSHSCTAQVYDSLAAAQHPF